ncbi:hypothetical protein PMKS-003983 [Pichia membranifaciens]|uniref:Major facilitator superfamily (MFS) profile domain-containing protein n=1 Tax=Pichia membranifaciens TaxID=4926 RepID=A0A1Q2YLR4_9ASCO|nr:hypothetical protein PMKS-003983 [Pichia membranifaciens]
MVSSVVGRPSSSIRGENGGYFSDEDYDEETAGPEDVFESIFDGEVSVINSDTEKHGNINDNNQGSLEEIKSKEDAVTVTEEYVVEYPEGGKLAYLTLFGCFMGLVGEFGLWNSTGAIESYIAKHILVDNSDIAISMIFALFSFFVMFGTMVSGVIFDKHVEIIRIKRLNEGERNMTLKEKLNDLIDFSSFKELTFMVLTGALFLNEFALLMVSTYIPSYALSKGFSESFSLIALTVFNAAGVAGRIVPTFLSDRYGNFNLVILMSTIMTLTVWIIWLPFGQNLGAFTAFTIVFGFAVAGTLALTPLCTSAISKPKDFGKRYGTAYFFVAFCNLISLPVGMALTETHAGYDAMVAFAGATCTLATVCFVYTRYRVGGLNKIRI